MKRIAIIHYQPLEYYPPVMNLINYLERNLDSKYEAKIYSSINQHKRVAFTSGRFPIIRSLFPKRGEISVMSLLKQIWFNFNTFIQLAAYRPNTVLYYETYSAFPVFLYIKLINRNTKLLIHFHEYFSKEWYQQGMKLLRYYQRLETKYLFQKAKAISHTNDDRVRLFLGDYPFLNSDTLRVIPNYPPLAWSAHKSKPHKDGVIRLVYIGSLSLKATYIRELCLWISSNKGNVSLDIFSFNLDAETSDYLKELQMPQVRFYSEGLNYQDIPLILKNYDVGLILYKGLSNNSKYCASNKLFEYLACGLDVWFSDKMVGTYPYIVENAFPKVLKMNFESLIDLDVEKAIDHEGLKVSEKEYFAEYVYADLLKELN